jgi:hypothetical protein
MAKKIAIAFISVYTIFFIYALFMSKTGDVSLFFAYFNLPTTLITLTAYDMLLSVLGVKYGNAIMNDIVVYLSGVFQYGLIGYLLGRAFW